MTRPKTLPVPHEHIYGMALSEQELLDICEIERNKIIAQVDRLVGPDNLVPPQVLLMIETDRLIASYHLN